MDKLIGWRMIVELKDGSDLWLDCSQEWENVLEDARNEFDKNYLVGPNTYAAPVAVQIDSIWSESVPTTKVTWYSKEEVQ